MILTSQEERFWFVRNLALGLISNMGAIDPPVWVENFLHVPLSNRDMRMARIQDPTNILGDICERLIYMGGRIISPSDLPEDERRYALAREVIVALSGSKHGRKMGLPQLIVPYMTELQDYFARVLLAPDPMINVYRKEGGEFRDFARAFLIPYRVADIRWQETTLQ
jgi:hypothetical protein